MRVISILEGEIYHICNRSVEGRKIFKSVKDCHYFLETAILVNTTDERHLNWRRASLRSSGKQRYNSGDPLVEVYAMVIMPDHFHILVKQLQKNGVARFIQRLCNSYSKYYNQKYKRKGALFMGRYKAVPMHSDSQAAHIFTYIHGNVLDLKEPAWREGKIKDWAKARKFLREYPWSSLNFYLGLKHEEFFEKIINKTFSESYYSRKKDFIKAIKDWGTRAKNIDLRWSTLDY